MQIRGVFILELLNKLNKRFDANQVSSITDIYSKLLPLYSNNGLYSNEFALKITESIIDNRLDYDSVIIGLIYPAFKLNNDVINSSIISDEIRNIFVRLQKIENLNLSTHQEQLENIKNMFIALAKDIRVIIIKLCIEEAKLYFLDKLNETETAKFMQEVTDVYFPICQMIGLSNIKNSFGNATFKYYKPHMYDELTNSLSSYIEERNAKIQEVIEKLQGEMISICPDAVVYGRQKQLYSIDMF